MSLYHKILLTLDCSKVDDVIVEHILELAEIHHSEVDMIHVLHSHTLDQKEYMLEQSMKIIKVYEEKFQKKKIPVKILLKMGEPEEEILKIIEKENYDLIALATHGHHFLMDILYGSVSDTLKHKINIPILLIKGKK